MSGGQKRRGAGGQWEDTSWNATNLRKVGPSDWSGAPVCESYPKVCSLRPVAQPHHMRATVLGTCRAAAHPLFEVCLCRHFYRGTCKRPDTCQYAHSLDELRAPPRNWPKAGTDMPGTQFLRAESTRRMWLAHHRCPTPRTNTCASPRELIPRTDTLSHTFLVLSS